MILIKSVIIRTFILLLAVEFFHGSAIAQKSRAPKEKKSIVQTPIRLTIQIPRKTWRSSEPIEVMAYLENVSQDKFFKVGRKLDSFFVVNNYHDIQLSIKDSRNREVPMFRIGQSRSLPLDPIKQRLVDNYINLDPGNIYGLRESFELPPGRYRLTANYRELDASHWTEEECKALPIPVWTEPLVSNTITITVIR